MRKKLAVMMATMAATAMVGGCGAKDAAPTGAETKPAETSAAQETEAAQEETKEAEDKALSGEKKDALETDQEPQRSSMYLSTGCRGGHDLVFCCESCCGCC